MRWSHAGDRHQSGPASPKAQHAAIQLAQIINVSRQTIYAIEAGTYVPNTAVALRLARALDTTVEDLFKLPDDEPAPALPSAEVILLPGSDALQPGQPVQLCTVDERIMASPPPAVQWYFPASDAVIAAKPLGGRASVQILQTGDELRNRILVAGCDPGISVLARHVRAAGGELVLANRNSSQSLKLLKEGCIPVAGTHLSDAAGGESNLPEIERLFAKNSVAVVSIRDLGGGNPDGARESEEHSGHRGSCRRHDLDHQPGKRRGRPAIARCSAQTVADR